MLAACLADLERSGALIVTAWIQPRSNAGHSKLNLPSHASCITRHWSNGVTSGVVAEFWSGGPRNIGN
jgi:hypothetical protein